MKVSVFPLYTSGEENTDQKRSISDIYITTSLTCQTQFPSKVQWRHATLDLHEQIMTIEIH